MVEHQFVAGRDTDCEGARESLDAAGLRLRSLDLTRLGLTELTTLSQDLESHRRVVAAAAARTAAEIAAQSADPAGAGDDSHGPDGPPPPPPPPPPPGGKGDTTGSDHDEANRQHRAARVAQILPSAMTALEANEITTGHVAALWFAVDADPARARRDEARLVRWARNNPVFRLRQLLRNWIRFGEDPTDRDAEQNRKRGVHIDNVHPDGMVRVNATMRTADGKEFTACLDALADDIYRREHPDRPRSRDDVTTTLAQRRHDALAEMSRRCTSTDATSGAEPATTGGPAVRTRRTRPPGTGRRRPTVTVIATLDQLRGHLGLGAHDDPPGLAETPDGDSLTPAELRRLACDAEILPIVMGGAGQPLDVGRSARTVSPAQWAALVARDRVCSHPQCCAPAEWCDAHHIIHWADGGPTALWNLTLLCRRHHTALHGGLVVVSGRAPHLQWGKPGSDPPIGDSFSETGHDPPACRADHEPCSCPGQDRDRANRSGDANDTVRGPGTLPRRWGFSSAG